MRPSTLGARAVGDTHPQLSCAVEHVHRLRLAILFPKKATPCPAGYRGVPPAGSTLEEIDRALVCSERVVDVAGHGAGVGERVERDPLLRRCRRVTQLDGCPRELGGRSGVPTMERDPRSMLCDVE